MWNSHCHFHESTVERCRDRIRKSSGLDCQPVHEESRSSAGPHLESYSHAPRCHWESWLPQLLLIAVMNFGRSRCFATSLVIPSYSSVADAKFQQLKYTNSRHAQLQSAARFRAESRAMLCGLIGPCCAAKAVCASHHQIVNASACAYLPVTKSALRRVHSHHFIEQQIPRMLKAVR